MQTWFITGASGGLGSRITRQLLDRLAALEAQKELAYSTDSDDVVKPL